MNRGCLGKEEVGSVERQIAVNLVGTYLMITCDTVFAAGVHQYLCAEDVGFKEDFGILDRAVNVALRRKVDHDVGLFLLKEPVHALAVTDIEPSQSGSSVCP